MANVGFDFGGAMDTAWLGAGHLQPGSRRNSFFHRQIYPSGFGEPAQSGRIMWQEFISRSHRLDHPSGLDRHRGAPAHFPPQTFTRRARRELHCTRRGGKSGGQRAGRLRLRPHVGGSSRRRDQGHGRRKPSDRCTACRSASRICTTSPGCRPPSARRSFATIAPARTTPWWRPARGGRHRARQDQQSGMERGRQYAQRGLWRDRQPASISTKSCAGSSGGSAVALAPACARSQPARIWAAACAIRRRFAALSGSGPRRAWCRTTCAAFRCCLSRLTSGPMARTVADAALLLSVQMRPDRRSLDLGDRRAHA